MALSLENVSKTVGGERHLIDINLTLEPGTINVVLGHTGAGKTSLLRILAGQANADEGEVRFGAGTRALYTTGGSNYRQVPIGVVLPKTLDDVIATVEICRAHDAPVISRGGGTSLAGQCCNAAVVMDHSK